MTQQDRQTLSQETRHYAEQVLDCVRTGGNLDLDLAGALAELAVELCDLVDNVEALVKQQSADKAEPNLPQVETLRLPDPSLVQPINCTVTETQSEDYSKLLVILRFDRPLTINAVRSYVSGRDWFNLPDDLNGSEIHPAAGSPYDNHTDWVVVCGLSSARIHRGRID